MKEMDETHVMLKAIMEGMQILNAKVDAFIVETREEFAAVRKEMNAGFASVRAEMATKEELAQVRAEMATKEELAQVRAEMATKLELAEVSNEMRTGFAEVRADLATTKRDIDRVVRTVIYLREKINQHDEAIHDLRRKRRLRFRSLF
jgi:paraquat-inducible protein B